MKDGRFHQRTSPAPDGAFASVLRGRYELRLMAGDDVLATVTVAPGDASGILLAAR